MRQEGYYHYIIKIGALKFMMWCRVTTSLRTDATGSCTIKEAGWVDGRLGNPFPAIFCVMHTELLCHFKVPLITYL